MSPAQITVTKPSLPDLDELIPLLSDIWNNKVLTNRGVYHQKLESALCDYLGVPYISLFCNGTLALITALKALNIKGEVITTPYSFVATAHSLVWNNIKPIFIDIDPQTLCLDPLLIEEAITPQTTGIMPVHVYGQPCDVDSIDSIAQKYNLKIIYDAAHAFGVKCHCGSILNHGDLSVLSFHATKVFNTFEGGAIICKNQETKEHIDQLKNFGFTSETSVMQTGINGKMSEFSSALGTIQLKKIDEQIDKRKEIDAFYRKGLSGVVGIRLHDPIKPIKANYSYFPIFVENNYPLSRDQLYQKLNENGIHSRRYFYPLITDFEIFKKGFDGKYCNFPVAENVAEKVICLPIYPDLIKSDIERVIKIISEK